MINTEFPLTFGSLQGNEENVERFHGTAYRIFRNIGASLKQEGVVCDYVIASNKSKKRSGTMTIKFLCIRNDAHLQVCISDDIKGPFRFDGLGCSISIIFDQGIANDLNQVEPFGDVYGCNLQKGEIMNLIKRQLSLIRGTNNAKVKAA